MCVIDFKEDLGWNREMMLGVSQTGPVKLKGNTSLLRCQQAADHVTAVGERKTKKPFNGFLGAL